MKHPWPGQSKGYFHGRSRMGSPEEAEGWKGRDKGSEVGQVENASTRGESPSWHLDKGLETRRILVMMTGRRQRWEMLVN